MPINGPAKRDLDLIGSRAMQRHEKVADRAGTLVTERVRAVMETAHGRAERIRRDAADEAHHLDGRRAQAASRIVSQIEDLEGVLGRLRQQMQADHSAEGSIAEGHLIQDEAFSVSAASTTTPGELEHPVTEVEAEEHEDVAAGTGEPAPDTTAEDDAQRSPFSFLRRRKEHEPDAGLAGTEEPDAGIAGAEELDAGIAGADEPDAGPVGAEEPDAGLAEAEEPGTEPDETREYSCVVCGRAFAGDRDELESLGWLITASGEVTCADCRSAGWLPPRS